MSKLKCLLAAAATETTMKILIQMMAAGLAVSAAAAETVRLPDFTWENRDPKTYHVPSIKIEGFKPGMRAEATMWVDASELSKDGVPEASLTWGSRKTGSSWAMGSSTVKRWKDKRIEKDAQGRRRFICRTSVMPADGTKPMLHFFAKKPAVGKIRYTDIELTLYPRTYDLMLANSAYANAAADGDVRFVASFVTDPDSEPLESLGGTFVFTDADGREARKPAVRLTSSEAEITLPVGGFATGARQVRFELSSKGTKVAETACPFERLAKPAAYRVTFDRFGHALVDGKPFFPLGMYWSENTLAMSNSLERYAAADVFNCLQTYEKAMTPEILDRYWAKGLRVMASVKDIYLPEADGTRVAFCPPQVKTKEQETAYVTDVVNRCKDHPALLAWYTCDEMKAQYAPLLNERYQLLKRLDPEHPVYVLAFADATRAFINAYDVTGTDPYPVCNSFSGAADQTPGMGKVWPAGASAANIVSEMFGLKPLWQVPQAFKWQWDHKDRFEERFPTRRELASMTWQQIAEGANGIFFYSYGQMCNHAKGESELMEYFDEITVPVAREVKRFIPVLLLDPGPVVAAKPAKTRVRTWTDGTSTYVLVCNTHPETRTGEVVVPGNWTSCDTLLGSGVSLKDGKLVLNMKPIDSAIVKIGK